MKACNLAALLLCTGIIHAAAAQQPTKDITYTASMDSALMALLQDVGEHFKDHETVICAYGVVSQDTVWVIFLGAATIEVATTNMVRAQHCGLPNEKYFGQLIYLGTIHNHTADGLVDHGCYFSTQDDRSFGRDSSAIVDIVICKTGLIVKYKQPLTRSSQHGRWVLPHHIPSWRSR